MFYAVCVFGGGWVCVGGMCVDNNSNTDRQKFENEASVLSFRCHALALSRDCVSCENERDLAINKEKNLSVWV